MKTKLLRKVRSTYSIIHDLRSNSIDVYKTNFWGKKKRLPFVGGYYIDKSCSLETATKKAKNDLQLHIYGTYVDKFPKKRINK